MIHGLLLNGKGRAAAISRASHNTSKIVKSKESSHFCHGCDDRHTTLTTMSPLTVAISTITAMKNLSLQNETLPTGHKCPDYRTTCSSCHSGKHGVVYSKSLKPSSGWSYNKGISFDDCVS